jgi:Carboxypeptidase regulatory-like domain
MSGIRNGFLIVALIAPFGLPAQDASKLPVKRVVLYKNGVGYFEHIGKVTGKQDVSIPFTSGQLNDVLKSLTVLDLDGGRITGVEYGSSAPLDRQLGDLRLPFDEKTTLTDFLNSLRGARLEIRNGNTVATGRLLSVERKTRMGGGATLEVDYVSLITDSGELKTTEVSPGFSVKLLDKGLAGKVDRVLDVISAGREADVRRMVVSTEGTGERSIFVSYISEVPVWKSTYRIVLNSKGGKQPLLQGWAIVDNTVGQDWENVQLSLVAGAPQSFVQNLSQPYYTRRPVVPMPQDLMAAPQTYQATLIPGGARLAGRVTDPSGIAVAGAVVKAVDSNGAVVGQVQTDSSGSYELAGLPQGDVRLQVDFAGFSTTTITGLNLSGGQPKRQDVRLQVGSTNQSVTVNAEVGGIQTDTATSVSGSGGGRNLGTGRALGSGAGLGGVGFAKGGGIGSGSGGGMGGGVFALPPAADAQELGDLFEYKLKDPITIQKNRSALVPIAQSNIGAEKVSIWNDRMGMSRAQRALWLNNSTGLTLDGGSFSVMEEETFAGEGVFDPIRPGEKRLVSYATDLALVVSSKLGSEQQRVTRVLVVRGVMTQQHELRERRTYTMRNEDTSPRSVIVEHPVRPGFTLSSEARPIETTADWMRFRVPVEPKQTATFVVDEVRPIEQTYQISNINSDQVALFVRQKSIDPTIEEALHKVLAQKAVVASLGEKKDAADEEMTKIFDDQQRLRENIKSLKGSPEEKALLQRYTGQMNTQENRLEALRKQIAELEKEEEAAQDKLNDLISNLSFDVKVG